MSLHQRVANALKAQEGAKSLRQLKFLQRLNHKRLQQDLLKTSQKAKLQKQINAESALGRTLFGPIPEGHQREFFHHKKNVWVWHENWTDTSGRYHELTLRYEVRPNGVYKRVNGHGSYRQIKGQELANFRHAAHAYLDLIKRKLYH